MNNNKDSELKIVKEEIIKVESIFLKVINILPSFDVTDEKVLPYGLRPHTRSISWIAEQVITQQAKYHKKKLGLDEVDIDMPDTCLHDCIIYVKQKRFFVNVKIHNIEGRSNKNDIAAVEKLYMQYNENQEYRLIYCCFGVKFRGVKVSFSRDYMQAFSPQFLPIYVNPRNDKIQAYYKHEPIFRSRKEFLNLLRINSKSIVL